MKIWKLEPLDPTAREWRASTYAKPVIVRAESEKRARQLAVTAFVIAVHHRPGEQIVTCPWPSALHVRATECTDGAYEADGQEGIVGPPEVIDHIDDKFLAD